MARCAYHVMLMRLLGAQDSRVPGTNLANFSVDSVNSIVGRVEALLKYLANHDKSGAAWAQYLGPDGHLRWDKVAVAGHSRASGIVAAMTKVPSIANAAQRMIMIGGPGDMVGNVSNISDASKFWRPDWVTNIQTNSSNLCEWQSLQR
jgi:hypothetical protein